RPVAKIRKTCPNRSSYARFASTRAVRTCADEPSIPDCSERDQEASRPPPETRSPMRGCASSAVRTPAQSSSAKAARARPSIASRLGYGRPASIASTHAGAAQQARSASRASSVPSTWNRASPASSAVTPESYAAEGTGASPAHPGTSGSVISRRHLVRHFRLEPSAIGRYKVRRLPALLVVCLAVFVDMLGFGIILPLLPFHIASLGGAGVWLGAITTAYAAAQFLAAPVLGALS